ncbi:MAG TPA: phosphatidylserine decarboxylase [Verrucomicrobiae bacterium]|jgi:phosphatidylserine decarboxylase|nr:phosphatidylserine decarboxylase [Verrucomicrobiae bacterium]
MKHSGKARKAAFKMIFITLVLVILLPVVGILGWLISSAMVAVSIFVFLVWCLFALFTLYFFRDPNARVPAGAGLVVSPGHGKVDVIDTLTELQFMGRDCQRISMFLSVIDVHVQNAPVSGKVAYLKYTEGQFLNAMKTECATCNENSYIGIESSDPPNEKIGVKLIAGVLARRIIPFVEPGDALARGDRISLIQFGSRVDVYLPHSAKIKVKIGDRVVGGETVLAAFE